MHDNKEQLLGFISKVWNQPKKRYYSTLLKEIFSYSKILNRLVELRSSNKNRLSSKKKMKKDVK